MEILHTTPDFVICRKKPGEVSEHTSDKSSLPVLLEKALGKKVYPVHRLDCTTGGLMVFALTSSAAADLSAQMQDGRFHKSYLAVVHGVMEEKSGILEDELFFDRRKGKSFICDKKRNGTKTARLQYAVLGESAEHGGISLCKIELFTGRTHQIRVQFGGRKHPLLGDGKYGSRSNCKDCALWSAQINFQIPGTTETVTFTDTPPTNRAFGGFGVE
ncbi:MAG: RNA pseudouridine synthase [Clostridia bacterium]|nr:RNA pseudouridine synthase [Clostridia bacterium]